MIKFHFVEKNLGHGNMSVQRVDQGFCKGGVLSLRSFKS